MKKIEFYCLGNFYFTLDCCMVFVMLFVSFRVGLCTGVALKDGELAYLIQFNDTHEPSFMKFSASRIWSHLIFDFLLEKIKYDGFSADSSGTATNILSSTADLHGPPEIVCKCQCNDMHSFLMFLCIFMQSTHIHGTIFVCYRCYNHVR